MPSLCLATIQNAPGAAQYAFLGSEDEFLDHRGTGVTAIQAVKGLPGGGLLTIAPEHRNIQFGLKLNF